MSNAVNILIAEDEFIVAENIKRQVIELGYNVVDIVSNENAIFEVIENHKIDLILMDIMLKGEIDGISVAEKVKQKYHISFVFITAYSSPEYFERARVLEPHGYLLKPFTNRDLSINIELAVYKHSIEKGLRETKIQLESLNQKLEETVAQRTENLREVNESLLREVKRRQLNERRVIESEQKYKELTEFLPIPILTTNDSLQITYSNIATHELFGINERETLCELKDLFQKSENEHLLEMIEKCKKTLRVVSGEFEGVTTTTNLSLIAYFTPIISNSLFSGIRVAFLDISHRVLMENQLLILSRAIEQAKDCIMITDEKSTIEYVNQAAINEYGYTYPEIINKTPRIFKTNHHDDLFYKDLFNTINSGDSFSSVFINKRKNNETFYEEKTISPVKDKNGEIKNYISTGRNITEKIKAEKTLIENQKFISTINNSVPIIIFIYNIIENRPTFINNQISNILGYSPEEICSFSFSDLMNLFIDYKPNHSKELLSELKEKKHFIEEIIRVKHKTLGLKWMSIRFVEFKSNETGHLTEIIGSATDITDQKQNERKLNAMMRLNRMQDKRTQKIRTLSLIEGQEEERRRISRDIHDGIGQMLTALKLNIENFDGSNFKTKSHILKFNSLKELIRETIIEVRRISNALAPPGLYDFGIYSVTKQLLEQLSKTASIKIHFDSNIQNIRYLPLIEVTLYRIIQESLNNTLKHSKAENIEISINQDEEFLQLVVFDDGVGLKYSNDDTQQSKNFGNGLKNIKERAIFIGAKFTILSKPKEGCIIKVTIPIENCIP